MIGTGAFWSTLRRDIEKERKELVERLASGGEEANYKRICGRIESLDWVRDKAARIWGGDEPEPRKREIEIEEETVL